MGVWASLDMRLLSGDDCWTCRDWPCTCNDDEEEEEEEDALG